jgi:TBC1 domain family member 5
MSIIFNLFYIQIDILFCYARQNPSICYRQGMHEILAPIIFVMYNDLQILEHIKETKPIVDEILTELLQMKYLEADAYSIFKVMMEKIVEPYYRIHDQAPSASGHFAAVVQPSTEQVH